jgi:hypothetical protein
MDTAQSQIGGSSQPPCSGNIHVRRTVWALLCPFETKEGNIQEAWSLVEEDLEVDMDI